jgi:transposase
MTKPEWEADTFRRIEVITGVGRRRRWTPEQKAAIVAETLEEGAAVSAVAQRHGVAASQVFAWRRAACQQTSRAARLTFAPVAIGPAAEAGTPVGLGYSPSLIEVEIEGAKLRIPQDAAAKTVRAVMDGLLGLLKRRR